MPDFGHAATFPAYVLRETPKALLCAIGSREVWIARSQIGSDSEVRQAGDQGQLIVTTWLAERLGLTDADVTFESNETTLPLMRRPYPGQPRRFRAFAALGVRRARALGRPGRGRRSEQSGERQRLIR